MNLLNKVKSSIRYKGVLAMMLPLLLIILFITIYYPSKQRALSFENVETQVGTLTEMLAFSVGAGLHDSNFELVTAAFEWAKEDKNVVFISILDENNESIIDYNPKSISINAKSINQMEYDESLKVYKNSTVISYKDITHGKIVMLYSVESVISKINESILTSVLAGIGVLLLGGIFGFIMINNITKGLFELRNASKIASEGNLNIEIKNESTDEIGDLAKAFAKMLNDIKKSTADIEAEKLVVEKKVEEAVKESEYQKNYLSERVSQLLEKMNRLSNGDLTVELENDSNDEINKLFGGFNNTVSNIRQMIEEVNANVNTTASTASEISASTEEMSINSDQQSMQANEVASAIQQMSATILENAKNASNAAEASKDANQQARIGKNKVIANTKGIERIIVSAESTGKIIAKLAERTDQIGKITQVIDDIADQTNLLALNAAIEAARAGDQGRGFAVVADEVRKLAERTTSATKEIGKTIQEIQNEAKEAHKSMDQASESVNEGKKLTDEVGESLEKILSATEKVSVEINQVAAASEEQSRTSEQITRSVETISTIIKESGQGINLIAHKAEQLNDLTNQLNNLVSVFRLGDDRVLKNRLQNRLYS